MAPDHRGWTLRITRADLLDALRHTQARRLPVTAPLAVATGPRLLLAQPVPTGRGTPTGPRLVVLRASAHDRLVQDAAEALATLDSDTAAALAVTGDSLTPQATVIVRRHGNLDTATLAIVGAGLPGSRPPYGPPPSRIVGALGAAAWSSLAGSTIGIIGCSRTGTLLATLLARTGVHHFVLVDPDLLESHNLDTLGTHNDIGHPKTEVLAAELRRISPHATITTRVSSVTHLTALAPLAGCDLLISCVDNDGARWATAILTTAYLQPHLDIGTGIHNQPDGRLFGADIRLTLPGETCLLCGGGLRQPLQVTDLLNRSPTPTPWYTQRAGSLPSLNATAAGLGTHHLEDLATGRLRRSRWTTLTHQPNGHPHLNTRTIDRNNRCPLCRQRGTGAHLALAAADIPASLRIWDTQGGWNMNQT